MKLEQNVNIDNISINRQFLLSSSFSAINYMYT